MIQPEEGLAGTVYFTSPQNAGSLRFYEPRRTVGTLWSTDFKPVTGDIVYFPPWLTHEVQPSLGRIPRIAMSFNIKGKWADTMHCEMPTVELDLPQIDN